MNVTAVVYYESGHRAVRVSCIYCNTSHEIEWPTGLQCLSAGLECGVYVRGIEVPPWAVNLRKRKRYRYDSSVPRPVLTASDRDSNAIHEPVPNWDE